MNISPHIEESYNRLRNKLSELLRDQNPKLTIKGIGEYPLLVMETSNDSAGFTIVNGAAGDAYSSTYETFKKLYREKHNVWKQRNLSFVVCSQEDLNKNESLFNSIESDVYFCRKYVVRFPPDQESFEQELLRLPFLPLDENYSKKTGRPIPAQNLLQELGISANLSRNLIQSGARAANGIIEDLMVSTASLAEFESRSVPKTSENLLPTKSTRLTNIVIEGFRAYGKEQKFDLNADLIVIYGQNGLGKTSFFDAIDYVTTGRIGRLNKQYKNSLNNFQTLAKNLDSHKSGQVTIKVKQGDSNIEICRKVDNWTYALFSDEKLDRKEILQKLTSANWQENKERIEVLERLFRATHLFSQSNPEFLTDFENDSNLSSDLVSRMLTMEDYASGLSKVKKVQSILEKKLKARNSELELLKSEIADLEKKKGNLPEPGKEEIGPKLKKMSDQLKKNIQSQSDINIDGADISKDTIRDWRSLVDAELTKTREVYKLTQSLESNYHEYETNKKNLAKQTKQQKKVNTEIEENQIKKKQLEFELEKLQNDIDEAKESKNQLQSKKRTLSEFNDLKNNAKEIELNLEERSERLKNTIEEISDLDVSYQKILSDLKDLSIQIIQIEESINKKSKIINILSEIKKNINPWEKSVEEFNETQKTITKIESDIEKTENAINKQRAIISEEEKTFFETESRLNKLTTNKNTLASLLDDIEKHVKDSICPACGTDHKSQAVLIKKIQDQKEYRPEELELLVRKVQELENSIAEKKDLKNELENTLIIKNKELEELSKTLNRLQKRVTKFESSLELVNLSSKGEEKISDAVKNSLRKELSDLENLKSKLQKIKKEQTEKAKQKNELEPKRLQLLESRDYINSELEDLKKQMNKFHSKAQEIGIPLNIDKEKLKSMQNEYSSSESLLDKKLADLKENIGALKEKIDNIDKLLKEKSNALDSLNDEIEHLQFELEKYEQVANKFFKNNEFIFDKISELSKSKKEQINDLQRLEDQILTLERALNSAELSTMVAELESSIKTKSNKKLQFEKEIQKLTELKEWFSKIRQVLSKQNKNAVENHVQTLGPLSSLIQKRLRTVYGFGDISLLSHGDEIHVEVDKNKKKVPPTHYFSDSQKQILMLSLFLSGRLTQTWSGFAPILLDDPVTHFDDLNAFGFVELIRGLVATSPGKRQFIISTCEERLFELMRKKFQNTAGGAKFYKFSGINNEGPIVDLIKN